MSRGENDLPTLGWMSTSGPASSGEGDRVMHYRHGCKHGTSGMLWIWGLGTAVSVSSLFLHMLGYPPGGDIQFEKYTAGVSAEASLV